MEETKELKVNVNKQLEKINLETVFEFQKTLDVFEPEKIKVYTAKDGEKTVCFLFYDNHFFAVNRVNFRDGYACRNNLVVSENLNYRIRKIPNVAKTRKILNIENIETRIYDIAEYIVLLDKEDIKLIKVEGNSNLREMTFEERFVDIGKIEEFQEKQYEIIREEKRARSVLTKVSEVVKNVIIEPLKLLKSKLAKTKDVQMLSDGKHSIFEKTEGK